MLLGRELATGFVTDDAQSAAEEAAGLPPEVADTEAKAPEAAREPEPAAAG